MVNPTKDRRVKGSGSGLSAGVGSGLSSVDKMSADIPMGKRTKGGDQKPCPGDTDSAGSRNGKSFKFC